jgi:hypothetical protein
MTSPLSTANGCAAQAVTVAAAVSPWRDSTAAVTTRTKARNAAVNARGREGPGSDNTTAAVATDAASKPRNSALVSEGVHLFGLSRMPRATPSTRSSNSIGGSWLSTGRR